MNNDNQAPVLLTLPQKIMDGQKHQAETGLNFGTFQNGSTEGQRQREHNIQEDLILHSFSV